MSAWSFAVRARLWQAALVLTFAAIGTAVSLSAAAQPAVPERADEYRIKAAILYNLAKFVEWPSDAFSDPSAPLVVCVLGADPFGPVLDEAFRNHLVNGRTVVARRITDVSAGCHILFVASSEWKRLAVIVDRLQRASVLTVSEEDGFTNQGGMIALATEGERVRFAINGAAADRARLQVSARLRALASGASQPGERPR